MGLTEYRRKRDFKKTKEPAGRRGHKRRKALRYCIQKHDATRLHYDFRLELGGVLLSWAVPKGPSLDPAERRLAVHVEDHPIEYGDFEGTIPAGQYGGGTVLLWDRGTWEPEGDAAAMLSKGSLKFRLDGEKLAGSWALVRMRGRENWLLLKHDDAAAKPGVKRDVTVARPKSVKTGRDLDEIAGGRSAVWESRPRTDRTPFEKRIAATVAARKKTDAKKRARRRVDPVVHAPGGLIRHG